MVNEERVRYSRPLLVAEDSSRVPYRTSGAAGGVDGAERVASAAAGSVVVTEGSRVPSPGDWLRQQAVLLQPVEEPCVAAPALTLEAVFAEQPVPLDVFVRDQQFIGMSALSNPQYDALRVAERVYYPELYPLMRAEWGDYWASLPVVNILTLLVGKGGG